MCVCMIVDYVSEGYKGDVGSDVCLYSCVVNIKVIEIFKSFKCVVP